MCKGACSARYGHWRIPREPAESGAAAGTRTCDGSSRVCWDVGGALRPRRPTSAGLALRARGRGSRCWHGGGPACHTGPTTQRRASAVICATGQWCASVNHGHLQPLSRPTVAPHRCAQKLQYLRQSRSLTAAGVLHPLFAPPLTAPVAAPNVLHHSPPTRPFRSDNASSPACAAHLPRARDTRAARPWPLTPPAAPPTSPGSPRQTR